MTAPRVLSSLLLLAAFLLVGLVHGDCESPPQNHPDPAMKVMLDCLKEFGQDRLCLADCMLSRLEVLTKEGEFQVQKAEEMIVSLPEGGMQEAFRELWKKCAKEGKGGKGVKVNRTMPNCTGLTKLAKCFRKVVTEKCPGLAKMLDMGIAPLNIQESLTAFLFVS